MYAVEMLGITKRFGSTTANDRVTLQILSGEIHSLLGENGAGKTTLMKILYGMLRPEEGEIRIRGERRSLEGPSDAIKLGIAMVHQHFMLVDALSVAENIVLGYEPRKGAMFDAKKAEAEVAALAGRFGMKLDPRQKVGELPVGAKQRVEILKALYREADVLILDEPTAVLTPLEVGDLFRVLRELQASGKTIVIITHKLKETMELANRATVLRGGTVVATVDIAETSSEGLAEMMVGRQVSFEPAPPSAVADRPKLLELKNVSMSKRRVPVLNNIDLSLYGGEIVGIAGVEGNGQTELIEAVTGLHPIDAGEVRFRDQDVTAATPLDRIAMGIGHIPEDRNALGLVGAFSLKENSILGLQRRPAFQRGGVLRSEEIASHAARIRADYSIKSEHIETPARALSGGNQQKIVIGRVLSQNPDVIVAAQPTRGVDIGAIEYIHERLVEMRDRGKAILLVSAELEEIRKLSDRIAVLYEGRIVAFGPKESFTENELGAYMTGGSADGKNGGGRE
ncbi:ABC transporter ATP-binding protein [Paenibacillus sp.]|uniref:ABC transporter ATP-binding protein n=1 Tax=Paenibacillus sp. TaxID=58172 RepID=UPI002D61EC4D|nr:ABC transporter ATP-binding protein [Paenibacillus sp.]HZG56622.1 ABC transporter ATP-binding protein [Paenibacillus sp.]